MIFYLALGWLCFWRESRHVFVLKQFPSQHWSSTMTFLYEALLNLDDKNTFSWN